MKWRLLLSQQLGLAPTSSCLAAWYPTQLYNLCTPTHGLIYGENPILFPCLSKLLLRPTGILLVTNSDENTSNS